MAETNVVVVAAAAAAPPEDFVASINAARVAKDSVAFAAVLARIAAAVPPVGGFRNTCYRLPGLLVVELRRKVGPNWHTLVDTPCVVGTVDGLCDCVGNCVPASAAVMNTPVLVGIALAVLLAGRPWAK